MASFSVGNVLAAGLRLVPSLTLRFAPVIAVAFSPIFLSQITGQGGWVLLYLVLEIAASAILTHAASESLAGHRTSALASVGAGLRRAPAAVGVMLLVYTVSAALMFAMWLPMGVAALVGGVIGAVLMYLAMLALFVSLYSRWFLAVPAVVVDGAGPMDALTRSGELTRGRRGRLAAIVVLLHGTMYGALVVAMIVGAGRTEDGELILDETPWFVMLAVATWLLYTVIRALLSAAAHHLIKRDVEAASPDELARVFG